MRPILLAFLVACGSGSGGPDAAPDPHEIIPCPMDPDALCERACADRPPNVNTGAETCLAWWTHEGERMASPCREANTFEIGDERGCCHGSGDPNAGQQTVRYFAVCE